MRPLRSPVVQLALLVAIAGPTHAQTVFGATDCGSWVNQPTEPRKAWLLGYMSGLNVRHEVAGLKPPNALDKVSSANQIFLWMDSYCRANPLKNVGDGGWTLFKELMSR
jgi:hypothetical protein